MREITVDPKGVLKLLNSLNIHKAPGPDGLSARVLKECSSEIAPILTLIYNESLAQRTVPEAIQFFIYFKKHTLFWSEIILYVN